MGLGAAVAGATLAAGIGGAVISSDGAKSAANTQANAASAASAQELAAGRQANTLLAQQYPVDQSYLTPYQNTGLEANNSLNLMTTNPAAFQAQFQASPGYEYNLQQQQGAIQNSAAAAGGLVGGNTLMALQNNASGLANQDYQQYIDNLMGQQNVGLQAGSSLANLGQTYAQNYGNNLLGTATQVGNNTIAAGNSISAGQIASGNALSGALSSGTNALNSFLLYNNGLGVGGSGVTANGLLSGNVGLY